MRKMTREEEIFFTDQELVVIFDFKLNFFTTFSRNLATKAILTTPNSVISIL